MSIHSIDSKFMNSAVNSGNQNTPEAIDASIQVTISDNLLLAFIKLVPPENGGASPTIEGMLDALSKKGVSYNINMAKLKELADVPIYHRSIIIASGVSPVNGVDGSALFKVEINKKDLKPKETENGKVDYRDLGIVENVSKDQVLCEITLPTEGSPGMTVRGEELLQKKGKAVPSYLGKNTELSEDGTAIYAKIDGQVEFKNSKVNVNETFYVAGNVDNSTGNINVVGNVVIKGGVTAGFKVEATGDIDVTSTVESSSIKAGGNVKLRSGITGSKVFCDGDLKSRFIESCSALVKGEINAEYILHSDIKCGKGVKVFGTQAKIIGGSCVAGQNIEANFIGSVANVKTKLEIGTDPAIIERQQSLNEQIPKLEKQVESLLPLLKLLRQLEASNRLTQEKKDALKDASYSYEVCTKLLEDAKKELTEFNESLFTKGYGRVICTGMIFPGTDIIIGGSKFTVDEALKNTTLTYYKGMISQSRIR